MRKITKESSEAFVNLKHFKKSNSEISCSFEPNYDDFKEEDEFLEYDAVSAFYLHGNLIAFMDETGQVDRYIKKASRTIESRKVKIDLCGYHTRITRERINGILDALGYDFWIAQRNHEQVLVRDRRWKFHDNGGWEESYSQDILKLSDDSFDPEFAKKVFLSRELVSGTDLNAIADF